MLNRDKAYVDWTPAKLDAMRRHLAAGFSASEVARYMTETFGQRFNKNHIIGKAHRLGISGWHRKEIVAK